MKANLSLLILLFVSSLIISCTPKTDEIKKIENFITVNGNKLMDGENEFRFISYNIPTLHYNEDEFEFSQLHAYSLPDEFELRDVFESVSQMGGKVVRLYTIPAKIDFEPEGTPTYVLGPNQFSEESFKTMDLVLALANEYNVRIIFSLLNNWQWMGGRPQYAHFRGKTKEEFWTDPQLIDDFKATIKYTINRTNTITGIPYKDDKAIMCWETGNELTCPMDWTIDICRYIKSQDTNHLVLDGYHAIDKRPVREGSIIEKSIDIVHSHHYEVNPIEFIENVNRNIEIIAGRKPYMIGEFGFVATPAIEQYINKILETDIVGMLIWGLRAHRTKGGFYWHSEPLGFGRYKSYHWPGFSSGIEYDEANLMALMREKAYAIDGLTPPPLPKPLAPELLPIEHAGKINWRGSAGASSYDLYRSETENGRYLQVAYNLSDANTQYFPLYNDKSVEIGKSYFYKLVAKNSAGESDFSNTVGPVKIESKALVDNMQNFSEMYFCSQSIQIETDDDRKFKEDMYRLSGNSGDEIIYFVPGKINSMQLYSFCSEDSNNLSFEISNDGYNFTKIEVTQNSYNNGKGDYGYWVPIAYSFNKASKSNYLKIKINNDTQLSRIELFYE
ncbi:MAG: hypothetical protein PF541_14520 [Prolixibacteraceae bacterium]|jgi:mannan endo-1,4-beta-mannosidase|nr:hypothetical protein [Prolixibacteraceae bacterium]